MKLNFVTLFMPIGNHECVRCTLSHEERVNLSKMSSSIFIFILLTTICHSQDLGPQWIQSNQDQVHRKCKNWEVCNKIDTYSTPWVERYCLCKGNKVCSTSVSPNDGHSISDKTRQFKICESASKLPMCRYFRDVTWTLTVYSDNRTEQRMGCVCPKNSVAYISRHQPVQDEQGLGHRYFFACSPESHLRCAYNEPCRLFTVIKRQEVEEVNMSTLCHCPKGSTCPSNHNDPGVKEGGKYPLDRIKTYTAFCNPVKFFHLKNNLDW